MEDDAIRVQHNGCPQYSLEERRRILQGLMRDGLPVMGHLEQITVVGRTQAVSPMMRLSAVACMDKCRPSTFSWNRSTHVGALPSLPNTVRLFKNVPSPESEILLAEFVLLLRGRDSHIFGSLVRYLALPCRLPWCLSDDILDPFLPPRGRLGSECRLSADATLQSYVQYLPRVFSRVRVIDLDANNAIVPSDATLLHRCCCRCGVFISPDGSEMRFVSHLYAVLTPTVGAGSVQRNDGKLAATILLKKWRAVCCASVGRWLWFSPPSSFCWLLCRYVCVSCVDAVLECVQCASCACRGRSHHYRARNGDAATMCVSFCCTSF
ncbi:hypothetical protein ECC02_003385 [Trypanosoma cruzi]|uniref:Uncharacterized protein n=1 Tax=Trypanosoma cruzi TaxID=5693 RepID=A0A7J6YAQ0_TRYCR|nr:hypothetical protein ECC02_003385 [Trypanosoma cruzi]